MLWQTDRTAGTGGWLPHMSSLVHQDVREPGPQVPPGPPCLVASDPFGREPEKSTAGRAGTGGSWQDLR